MSTLHRFPDPIPVAAPPVIRTTASFGRALLRAGLIEPEILVKTLIDAKQMSTAQMVDMLVARGIGTDTRLYDALADHLGLDRVDPLQCDRDPRLLTAMGATQALRACMAEAKRSNR